MIFWKMTNKRTSQAQKLTLWEMLDKYNIEIPKIQRDYAQGRKGKNELRRAFLGDLYDALVRRKNDLKLDFVYGTEFCCEDRDCKNYEDFLMKTKT